MTESFGVAVFSIAAHIALGVAIFVASLLAGEALPTPRSVLAFEFHERLVNLPRDIELPARQTPAAPAGSARAPSVVQLAAPAAPIVAPDGLQPETTSNEATAGTFLHGH